MIKQFLICCLLFAVLLTRGLRMKVPFTFYDRYERINMYNWSCFCLDKKRHLHIFLSYNRGKKKDSIHASHFSISSQSSSVRQIDAYKIEWPSLMHGRFLLIEVDDLRSCRAHDELSRQRGRILRSKNRCAEVDAVACNPLKIAKSRRCSFSLDTLLAQNLPGQANNRF